MVDTEVTSPTTEDATVELPTGDLFDAGGAPLTDIEGERLLLGYLLMSPDAIGDVVQEVTEGDFFDVFHRRIFSTFVKAAEEGWKATMPSVAAALGIDPTEVIVGGLTVNQYLARLMAASDMTIDPGELAGQIQQLSERRAVGAISNEEMQANLPFVSKMGLTLWTDQNDPGEEYEYLVEDLIPEHEGALMMGESQTGKSFLTYHLAMCVARGVPFFGRRVLRPRGVIWCAYEASRGAKARMRAYRKHHGLEVADLPFAVLTKPLSMWPADNVVERLSEEMNGIARTYFGEAGLGLMVFDTYNAATPGASEIDSEVVSKIRVNFDRLREITGAASLLVGHTNSVGKHRGNEQLTNNIDTVIVVSRKMGGNARQPVQLKDDDGRDLRAMKVRKQREGRDGEETEFVLREVADGTFNKFGRERTSCVVTSPNIAEPLKDGEGARREDGQQGAHATKQEQQFVEVLLECLDEQGIAPPAELGLPKSIGKVVDYDIVKREIAKRMLREDDNTPEGEKAHRERVKKALKRCRQNMMHVRVVDGRDQLIWWTGKPVRGIKRTQPKKSRDMFADEPPMPVGIEDFF